MKQIALLFTLLAAFSAHGWNSLGHQVIAQLAWRKLEPAQQTVFSQLLREHPHYKLMLLVDKPEAVNADEWVFLQASTWLDRVRPARAGEPPKPEFVTRYNTFPHAIGFPFVRAQDKGRVSLEKFYIASPNAEMVFSNAIATLKDPGASTHDRAVGLCAVLHLCGDLHQPLHAANLITEDQPLGQNLGGTCFVRGTKSDQISLHALWDYLPGQDSSYTSVTQLVARLEGTPSLQPDQLKEYCSHQTIPAWVQESFKMAVEFAYHEKHVRFVTGHEIKSKRLTADQVPMVEAKYIRGAHEMADRRLALAGQRLADILREVKLPLASSPNCNP